MLVWSFRTVVFKKKKKKERKTISIKLSCFREFISYYINDNSSFLYFSNPLKLFNFITTCFNYCMCSFHFLVLLIRVDVSYVHVMICNHMFWQELHNYRDLKFNYMLWIYLLSFVFEFLDWHNTRFSLLSFVILTTYFNYNCVPYDALIPRPRPNSVQFIIVLPVPIILAQNKNILHSNITSFIVI